VEIAAIIVAAGRGHRAGGGMPKQYRFAGDKMILTRSIEAILNNHAINRLCVVIHPDDKGLYAEAVVGLSDDRLLQYTLGGTTRAISVKNGLESFVDHQPDKILIHDAARPFLSTRIIDNLIDALDNHHGAFPVVPVAHQPWPNPVSTCVSGKDMMFMPLQKVVRSS